MTTHDLAAPSALGGTYSASVSTYTFTLWISELLSSLWWWARLVCCGVLWEVCAEYGSAASRIRMITKGVLLC